MMNSDKFISMHPDVIESDAIDISTTVTAHISSNNIEGLFSVRDCQIRENRIVNITLTYNRVSLAAKPPPGSIFTVNDPDAAKDVFL